MGDQALNLSRSLRILRRRWTAVGILAALGFVVGAGYTLLNPSMYQSSALVALPTSTTSMTTQAVIATSDPVLAIALRSLGPGVSLRTLSSRVQVTTPFSYVLSFDASGETAAQAKATANAVAASYVAYASAAGNASGQASAVLQEATSASQTPLSGRLLITAGLGAMLGLAIGVIGVLAVGRGGRRLGERDEVADAIGVPVLASLEAQRPADAARWARLLDDYEPNAADAWRLRSALHELGLSGTRSADITRGGSSLAIFSLSCDPRALALGPQLAVFAASLGIPTALVIDPRHNDATAALRAACAIMPSPKRSSRLRVAAADHDILAQPDAVLTVIVGLADARTPQFAGVTRTDTTVLGVSAGAVTAEQLARVAAGAAANGRHISGIFVADPDPADPTTGRLPQLTRQTQMPTRVTGTTLVTRR